jgi:hypothetical protein
MGASKPLCSQKPSEKKETVLLLESARKATGLCKRKHCLTKKKAKYNKKLGSGWRAQKKLEVLTAGAPSTHRAERPRRSRKWAAG